PLVRDFLRAELKSTDVELYRALHVRASERAEALGQQSEAISHQIEGGNWREVARLVTQQAPKFYRLGRWHTIAAWLRAIPSAQLDENPDLRWWEARILARLGQIDSALRVISEALPQTNDLTRVAQFETLRASALRGKGDVSGALAAAQRALELSLEQNAPIDTVAEARKELGLALVAEGAFTPAIDELRAALALQEKSGNTEESAFLNGCLGSALGSVGSLVESAEHLERSRQQWQAAGNAKELSWVLNNLGMVYQRAGQLEMASDILKQCIGKSRQSGNRRAEAYALSSLGEIELAAGDVRSAKQRYEEASEISVELDDNTALTHARCGLAYCYGKLGEARKGQTLARQALASAEERGSPFEQGIALSAIGSLLRQQGSLNEAVERFSEAVSLFEQTSSTPELAKTLLLLSDAALPLRGSRSMVRVSLDRFVRLTDDLGEAAYSLVPAGEIEPLLEFGASRKAGGALFREMLRRSVKGGGDNTDTEQPTPESRLPSIEMRALGTFEVSVDGRTVLNVEWESEKSKELFLLIASAPRPLTRDGIIAALWPEAGGKKATSAFHSTLHRLRGATYREAITESGGEYCLNVKAHLKSDLGAFNQAIAEAEDPDMDEAVRLGALRRAVDLYKGSFAPGFDGEWTTAIRMSLEEQFLRASFRLTEKLIAAGDYKAAIASCERILEVDPFSESACRHLMKSHVAMGDSESALRAYRRFSEALELELGETPGAGLRRLHVEIRGQANRSLGLLS
ncbi:MAG: BTAD domain-containing putative transcriptional regulator, partial [Dehalococcoidia bacterium]